MSKEYYLFVDGQKVVVTKEIYQAYWKMENREKYLRQLDKKHQLLCFSDLDHDGNFEDNLVDTSVDVEKLVEAKTRIEALYEALAVLNSEEREIINALYFDEQTTRAVASKRGLHQTTLLRKRNRILKKLREILEEKI